MSKNTCLYKVTEQFINILLNEKIIYYRKFLNRNPH